MASQKVVVELSDLDWEDRERILRLLFQKMNTGLTASNWRENPDQRPEGASSQNGTGQNHSFREQEEEDYDEEADAQVFAQTTVPQDNLPHRSPEGASSRDEYGDQN